MYLPKHFEVDDEASVTALMSAHPLAQVVFRAADGALDADPVPLLYDAASRTLLGHVARANPLWRSADGQPVLAIFSGAQAYVSPNWYPSKAATHKAVPTWNYAVVHAHGTLHARDDAAWLRQFLPRLTARHEAAMPKPWSMADAPEDYLQQMLRAIVGLEIPLTRVVGKFKGQPESQRGRPRGRRAGPGRASDGGARLEPVGLSGRRAARHPSIPLAPEGAKPCSATSSTSHRGCWPWP